MNLFTAYKTIHKLPIRSSAILVYYDLTRRTNSDNECWPSKQTIAKACHISVSTVTRSLRELEKAGMILTVYRYRDDNNRQTSNIYKVFDTPQSFSVPPECPDYTEDVLSQQLTMDKNSAKNAPAACQQMEGELSGPSHCLPESSVHDVPNSQSNDNTAICFSSAPEPAQSDTSRQHHTFSPQLFVLSAFLCFFRAECDTPQHVSVTPQGTRPEKKVTDNLRSKSIFSKLAKWYIERHRKKHAGLNIRPAQNE